MFVVAALLSTAWGLVGQNFGAPRASERGMKRALPTLRITTPCPMDWAAMAPGAGGARHCHVCRKDVHDLASMTEAEARALLAGGRACVRVRRSATLPAAAVAIAAVVFTLTSACSGADDAGGETDQVGAPPAAAATPAAAPTDAAHAAAPDPNDYLMGDVDYAH